MEKQEELVKCRDCGEEVTKRNMKHHRYRRHSKQAQILHCVACKVRLAGEQSCKRHQTRCDKFKSHLGECPALGCYAKDFFSWELLSTHIREHHEKFVDYDGYLAEPLDMVAVKYQLSLESKSKSGKKAPQTFPSQSETSIEVLDEFNSSSHDSSSSSTTLSPSPPLFEEKQNLVEKNWWPLFQPFLLHDVEINEIPVVCKNHTVAGYRNSMRMHFKELTWFRHFPAIVQFMYKNSLDEAGAIVLRAPPGFKPSKTETTKVKVQQQTLDDGLEITEISKSEISSCYKVTHKKWLCGKTFREYKEEIMRNETDGTSTLEDRIKGFWQLLESKGLVGSQYATGIRGNGFDVGVDGINADNLGDDLQTCPLFYYHGAPSQADGLTTSMLYIGQANSAFTLHSEDFDFGSLSYLHEGMPKIWWIIPPAFSHILEKKMAESFPEEHRMCHGFLRHKQTLVTPKQLDIWEIPYNLIIQEPGDYVLLAAKAYHMGINSGWNYAQAINYSTPETYEFVKCHMHYFCSCPVKMNQMYFDALVQKYEPEENLEAFKTGRLTAMHPNKNYSDPIPVLPARLYYDEYYKRHDEMRSTKRRSSDPFSGMPYRPNLTRIIYHGPREVNPGTGKGKKKEVGPSNRKKQRKI